MRFKDIDPLGAGLREEILRQQSNPDSRFDLFEQPTGEGLQAYIKDLKMVSDLADAALSDFDVQEN